MGIRERIADIFRSFKDWWMNLSRKAKIIIIVALALALIMSLVTVLLLNNKDYILLYNGASPHDGATVLAALQEMGVDHQVRSNGAMYVLEEDYGRVRMRLAQDGFQGNFGYEIFDSAGLTATQSDKNQLSLYQLQDRLGETIKMFPEVDTAVVNITAPQPTIYALQDRDARPRASVTMKLKQGASLTHDQIQAILNLVKTSVADLEEDDIAITDGTMDLKAAMLIVDPHSTSTTKLGLMEEINRTVRDRVMAMLMPAFGSGNFTVGVNTVLDTDRRQIERIEYHQADEEDPRNNPVDNVIIERERLSTGGDDYLQGVVGANDNVDVPQYAAEDFTVGDADHFVARDVINYLVSETRETIEREGLTITDMSVAVLINSADMPNQTRDAIIDLVAKAATIPRDNVSVQSFQFVGTDGLDLGPEEQNLMPVLLATAIMFLMLCLIFFLFIMRMRKKQREAAALAAEEAAALEAARLLAEEEEAALLAYTEEEEEDAFEPIVIPETPEAKLKGQIKDLAISDPEIVANLLKTWLAS